MFWQLGLLTIFEYKKCKGRPPACMPVNGPSACYRLLREGCSTYAPEASSRTAINSRIAK